MDDLMREVARRRQSEMRARAAEDHARRAFGGSVPRRAARPCPASWIASPVWATWFAAG